MANKSAVYLILICFLSVFIFSGSSHDPGLGPPFLDSLTPNSGSSFSSQPVTFTAVYGDPDGAAKIYSIGFLLSATSAASSSAIGIIYLGPSQGPHTVLLGDGVQNNICDMSNPQVLDFPSFQMDCSQLSVVMQGNLVTVNWPFVFKAPFAGTKDLYMSAKEKGPECAAQGGASTGWVDMGDWTVLNNAPDLTPLPEQTGAENSLITFTLSAYDPDGDPLTYSMINAPQDAELIPETGVFSWTPESGDQGSYPIDFSVTDGNLSDTEQIIVTVTDGTPPVTTVDPPAGNFIGSVDITLTANEPSTIYFTTDGFDPNTSSQVYSAPIHLTETTTLKFFAVDTANNVEAVKTEIYTRIGGPTYVSGQITEDTVWTLFNSPYIVQGAVSVGALSGPPVTLTIEAGVEVRFDPATILFVGDFGNASLIAQGTPTQPIRFTSNQATPSPGNWEGIFFYPGAQPGTILENCVIEYGGTAGVTDFSPQLIVRNSTIQNNSGAGLQISGGAPIVEGTSFLNNLGNAVTASSLLETRNFASSNTYMGNGNNVIEWMAPSSVSQNVTLKNQGVPYVAKGFISVGGFPSPISILTIEPGVEIRFDSSVYMEIGFAAAVLIAQGTPAQPIRFTSNQAVPSPGDWGGILFYAETRPGTILEHCIVEYANTGIQESAGTGVTIRNSVIQFNAGDGIWTSSIGSLLVYQSSFPANGMNAINNLGPGFVHAQLNWWGDASGPSGTGVGTGVPIAGDVKFDPWLESPVTHPFQWSSAHVSPRPFKQTDNSTTFRFNPTQSMNWTIEILDAPMTQVLKTFTGSGSQIIQDWSGDDNTATPLADGEYRFRVSGTSVSGGIPLVPAVGIIALNQAIPIAKITQPVLDQLLPGFTVTPVIGTASDTDFKDYKLERLSNPPFEIVSSTTPVDDNVLANWDVADSTEPFTTIRLTVTDLLDQVATDEITVRILNVASETQTENYISPNGDTVKDQTLISATSTFPTDWTLEIKDGGNQVVRTFNLSNQQNSSFTWDGLNDSAVLVPDGPYTTHFTITDPLLALTVPPRQGATPITVDVTPPEALITDPTPSQFIRGFNYDIQGTANDLNFQSYDLDVASDVVPDAFLPITGGNAPVLNAVLGTWGDVNTLDNGGYSIRLRVTDLAGNISTAIVPVTLDNLTITNVSRAPTQINPNLGETTALSYEINHPATVAIKIFEDLTDALVKTLIANQPQPAGLHQFLWDATDDSGGLTPLKSAYYFTIEAQDELGIIDQYIPSVVSVSQLANIMEPFDPYKNDLLSFPLTFDNPARASFDVLVNDVVVKNLVTSEPFPAATPIIYWDGRDAVGNLIPPGLVYVIRLDPFTATGLRENVIITKDETLRVDSLRANAYVIVPVLGEVSKITYTLPSDALVTLNIKDPNGNHFRNVLTNTFQTAGSYEYFWDGTDDNGDYIAVNGHYTLEFFIEDPAQTKSASRHGNVTVVR